MVGLGPAGPDLLTARTDEALNRIARRYVRTSRHPAASAVRDAVSFDDLYDSADSLEKVYTGIVEALVATASGAGEVLYAVPGSPVVAERTVELLRADPRVDVELLPALSFLDLAWICLGIDPLAEGVRLVDGRRFSVEAAGQRGPLLVAQCDSRPVLSDIKLALGEALDHAGSDRLDVIVLARLGLPDQAVTTVAWHELDRAVDPDHLTTLYLSRLAAPVATEVARFDELVRDLRTRCPWDREQTHASLTRHLLEESYEVLEAIDGLPADEAYANLEEELGDLLFQVVFHSTLAAEAGRFNLADVARGVHDKLVHRHPHVFGSVVAHTAKAVLGNWERIKQAEKGRASVMDGIPGDLPALLYAAKVQRKAASWGIDSGGGLSWLEPVTAEADVAARLFATVAEARHAGIDPETALRSLTIEFRRRVMAFERLAAERALDIDELSAEERALLWEEAALAP